MVGGAIVLTSSSVTKSKPGPVTPTTTAPATATPTKPLVEHTAVIATKDTFSPGTITVKAGAKVVWTNKSGGTLTVNSDAHPTHVAYPPLNLGAFPDGASVQLTFDKPGKYAYHNHLNPSMRGTVIVE